MDLSYVYCGTVHYQLWGYQGENVALSTQQYRAQTVRANGKGDWTLRIWGKKLKLFCSHHQRSKR